MCDTLNDEIDRNIGNTTPSSRNTEEIEMEEFDFPPDLQPEPPDAEWLPLVEDLF